MKSLVASMNQLLFEDVDFTANGSSDCFSDTDDAIFKEQLLTKFFSDMSIIASEWKQKSEDSTDFYGRNVIKL